MKRLTTLLLAAGLICSAFSAANAADIKAKGMWDFSFEYTNDSRVLPRNRRCSSRG